ncbi:MAG: hypothetical protein AB1632_05755 [Nitrospirota bacterium]
MPFGIAAKGFSVCLPCPKSVFYATVRFSIIHMNADVTNSAFYRGLEGCKVLMAALFHHICLPYVYIVNY